MKLQHILTFAHTILQSAVSTGDTVVDATVGNGHDTQFLAELVGNSGHVFGFDIQREAVDKTQNRMAENKLSERVTIFHKGHETIRESIPGSFQQKISCAIFNLGYLPGGNKSIATHSHTTITAIEQLLDIMAPDGIIVVIIYPGHPEGLAECNDLLRYVMNLDQEKANVLRYEFMNQRNSPPFMIAIEKK